MHKKGSGIDLAIKSIFDKIHLTFNFVYFAEYAFRRENEICDPIYQQSITNIYIASIVHLQDSVIIHKIKLKNTSGILSYQFIHYVTQF